MWTCCTLGHILVAERRQESVGQRLTVSPQALCRRAWHISCHSFAAHEKLCFRRCMREIYVARQHLRQTDGK